MNVGFGESTGVLYIGEESGVDFKSATAFRRRICIFEKALIRVKPSDWWLFCEGIVCYWLLCVRRGLSAWTSCVSFVR